MPLELYSSSEPKNSKFSPFSVSPISCSSHWYLSLSLLMALVLPPCLQVCKVPLLIHSTADTFRRVFCTYHFRLAFFSIAIPLLNSSFKSYIPFFITLMCLCSLPAAHFLLWFLSTHSLPSSVWDCIWLWPAAFNIGLAIFMRSYVILIFHDSCGTVMRFMYLVFFLWFVFVF